MAGIFTGVKDASLKAILERFADFTRKREPAKAYQIVDVVFATANQDLDIVHNLMPLHPEDVRYSVLRQGANAVIYQDLSATRTPWAQGVIHLRASFPTSARLLLTLETDATTPALTGAAPVLFKAINLTDYASGTWTPTDASGASLALTVAETSYIKIGNLVFATAAIVYPATANGAANTIGGLPFTASGSTSKYGAVIGYGTLNVATTALVIAGTTHLQFQSVSGGAWTNANLSGASLRFTAVYQAAD